MEIVQESKGSGLTLQALEKMIKETLVLSDNAEVRYTARHNPVRVRLNYHSNEFWITELSLDKDGLVITIDPVF